MVRSYRKVGLFGVLVLLSMTTAALLDVGGMAMLSAAAGWLTDGYTWAD